MLNFELYCYYLHESAITDLKPAEFKQLLIYTYCENRLRR